MAANKSSKKVAARVARANPWGHFRSVAAAWTRLERRGEAIVLAQPSNHTATDMRHDYDLLYWNARQLNQWTEQTKKTGRPPSLEDAKNAFQGSILVGDSERVPYVTDEELAQQIAHPESPSSFAEQIVTKRWGFTQSSGRTYLHRKPQSV